MNIRTKIRLGVVAAVMAATPLRAGIVYQCDFEDATENAQWVLNAGKAGPTLPSIWYIGEPGNFSQTGQNGLFISSDGGNSAVYTANSAEGCVAYRAMTLTPGSYDLDFDWRCMGTTNTNIIVAWVSQSTTTNSAPATLTTNVTNNQIGDKLYGSRGWRSSHITFTVTAANSAGKLVFAWSGAKDTPKPPSGCVDNIVIKETPVVACTKPKNVKYDKQTAYLSWTGPNDIVYQVRDYCSNDGSLIEYDSITDTRLRLMLNSEGTHTFSVRADCGDGNYSEWVSTSTFVWIPGLRCIEYLDIDGVPKGHAGICYTGVYTDYRDNNRPGQIGMVDLGSDNNNSLHTIHTNLDETDFNTDGLLNVVPDGEIASVRLGGREYPGPESRSASIEYQYYVQRGMSDLLDLKFAVVMQDGNHGEGNPSFRLDILDGRGQPLESSCTHYNFIVGFGEDTSGELWHQGIADSDVSWSDWQKVTVSLRPYVGQTLTIRLTAVRCNVDTHFSYAYFTLGCRSGDIEGLSCGDTHTDHFDAPEGFSYRWYKEEDPTRATLPNGTNQRFDIDPTDTCVYMVECHSLVDYSCYYTLTANPNPRYPEAIGDTVVTHENCQNLVTFSNNSVVRVMNRVTGMTMSIDEPIYTVFFDYGDGKQESVKSTSIKHEYPAEGGHFDAYMIASMNDGECEDTIFYSLDLPDILHTGSMTIEHLCRGEKFQLPNGEWVEDDTLYTSYTPNKYGCEAPNELYVYFHDSVAAVTDTTFCDGGYIDFEGSRYTETGTYRVNLLTQYGCDSSLTLNLTVLPRLLLEVPDTVVACGDFGNGEQIIIPHEVLKGRYNGVDVHIDNGTNIQHPFDSVYSFGPEEEIMIPVPDSVRPNYYNVMLDPSTDDCPTDSLYLTLFVKYASQIMAQKYGFVALLNADHNYGEFGYLSYEWYRNDSLMIGENNSYIHVTGDDLGADFHVVVTRSGDGTRIPSCALTYTSEITALNEVAYQGSVRPTLVGVGQNMLISGMGHVAVVDVLGRVVETMSLGADVLHTTSMKAPNQKGIYFVIFDNHDAIKIQVR